tara:strand:+ start:184 stop:312 length:129 start_codon:yes stop_codon:yes gene_type:complete
MPVPNKKGRIYEGVASPYKWVAATKVWVNIYNGSTSGGREKR